MLAGVHCPAASFRTLSPRTMVARARLGTTHLAKRFGTTIQILVGTVPVSMNGAAMPGVT